MTEDQQLLQQYVRDRAAEALNELIRRYRDLVYSSALRQVRDPHLAEDVAQAVFIILSKKASTIRQGVALGGWLLAVTRRAALNAMKKQAIQHRHERAAAKTEVFETAEANWKQIDPVLDSVMSRLPRVDRDAVVLRFFQQRSFAQVGAELGLSEDAARKRVERAIQRMRGLLQRQGVSLGAAALGTTIAAHSVHASPATIAGVSQSTSAATLAKGVMTMMTLTKLKAVALAAAMFLMISGGAALVMTAMAQQPADALGQTPPTSPIAPPTTVPFNADAAREAILLRFQSFQNFSVSYHMESIAQTVAGRVSGVSSAATTQPATPGAITMSEDHYLSRLGDKFRIEFENHVGRGTPDASRPDAMRTISTFTGEHVESLTEITRARDVQRTGVINPPRTASSDWVEWVLGLGSSKNNVALNPADVALMDLAPGPNGDVILRQTDDTKTIAEWEFRPSLGYAIVAYRAIIQPETRPNIEVTAEDFRTVHGVALPYTFHLRYASMRNGQWTESQRITATVKECKLNDPQNTDQRYHIAWPAGTKVTDMRTKTEFVAGPDGELVSPAK